jgi:hypothetical protein
MTCVSPTPSELLTAMAETLYFSLNVVSYSNTISVSYVIQLKLECELTISDCRTINGETNMVIRDTQSAGLIMLDVIAGGAVPPKRPASSWKRAFRSVRSDSKSSRP